MLVRRPSGPPFSAFVVAGLVAALLTAGPPAAAAPARLVYTTSTSELACQDVVMVGARGSGEQGPGGTAWSSSTDPDHGLGAPVAEVLSDIRDRAPDTRRTALVALTYAADSVTTVFSQGVGGYVADLGLGQVHLLGYLQKRAFACPDEHVVLAGYSQGAMLTRRVVQQLAASTTPIRRQLLAHLDAVVLVADGDRVIGDSVQRYGTAPDRNGIGVQFRSALKATGQRFPATLGSRVWSLCAKNDVVCDFRLPAVCAALLLPSAQLTCSAAYVSQQVKIHLRYAGSTVLADAGAAAAAAVYAQPVVRASSLSVETVVDTPVNRRLLAWRDPASTLTWSTTGTALSSRGLRLAANGLLTGPAQPVGDVTAPVQVVAAYLGVPGRIVTSTLTLHVRSGVPELALSATRTTGPAGFATTLRDLACPAQLDGMSAWVYVATDDSTTAWRSTGAGPFHVYFPVVAPSAWATATTVRPVQVSCRQIPADTPAAEVPGALDRSAPLAQASFSQTATAPSNRLETSSPTTTTGGSVDVGSTSGCPTYAGHRQTATTYVTYRDIGYYADGFNTWNSSAVSGDVTAAWARTAKRVTVGPGLWAIGATCSADDGTRLKLLPVDLTVGGVDPAAGAGRAGFAVPDGVVVISR